MRVVQTENLCVLRSEMHAAMYHWLNDIQSFSFLLKSNGYGH